jgi:hypothetical protein
VQLARYQLAGQAEQSAHLGDAAALTDHQPPQRDPSIAALSFEIVERSRQPLTAGPDIEPDNQIGDGRVARQQLDQIGRLHSVVAEDVNHAEHRLVQLFEGILSPLRVIVFSQFFAPLSIDKVYT